MPVQGMPNNYAPNGKLARYGRYGYAQMVQFHHLLRCLFAYRGRRTVGTTPSFFRHVSHIIGSGAQEQMLRVYAPRVVAAVQHTKTGWYFPNVQFIGYAVGDQEFVLFTKPPVPTAFVAGPLPAGRSFFNQTPEVLFERDRRSSHNWLDCNRG